MQMKLGIIGQPRVTVTVSNVRSLDQKYMQKNVTWSRKGFRVDPKSKKAHFRVAQRRLSLRGADGAKFFPLGGA